MTHGESPMGGQAPPELKDKVMHSYLESGNIALMASDYMEACQHGNSVYLCLVGERKGESKSSTGGSRPGARSTARSRKSSSAPTAT